MATVARAYPATLPCPAVSLSGTAAAAVLRTPFDSGLSRQRRTHRRLPTLLQLEWLMDQKKLATWMSWVNDHAWEWFQLKLPGELAGAHNEQTWPHTVRFTSDLEKELIAYDGKMVPFWRVSVQAEWNRAIDVPHVAALRDSWIIGGSATAPESEDVIGGTADIPEIEVIIAGTATAPNAIV